MTSRWKENANLTMTFLGIIVTILGTIPSWIDVIPSCHLELQDKKYLNTLNENCNWKFFQLCLSCKQETKKEKHNPDQNQTYQQKEKKEEQNSEENRKNVEQENEECPQGRGRLNLCIEDDQKNEQKQQNCEKGVLDLCIK